MKFPLTKIVCDILKPVQLYVTYDLSFRKYHVMLPVPHVVRVAMVNKYLNFTFKFPRDRSAIKIFSCGQKTDSLNLVIQEINYW